MGFVKTERYNTNYTADIFMVLKIIESKNEANRNLEKVLEAFEQVKQRVANEWSYELAKEVMRDYVQRKSMTLK